MKDNLTYQFSDFRLEVRERRLKLNQKVISLTPKAFETLLVLIQNRGRVVEKEFLLNRVWGDTFVEEATLTRNISTLRKALGTGAFIETVPRYGYRFIAETREIVNREETGNDYQTSDVSEYQDAKSDLAPVKIESLESGRLKTPAQKRSYLKAVVFGGIILLIGAWILAVYLTRPVSLALSKFEQISFSKLTTSGDVYRLALSPDGKYLAYVESKGENQVLMLRQIADENLIVVVPSKKQQYTGLTFSPDGRSIYYVARDVGNSAVPVTRGNLYRVSLLGGAVEKVLEDIDSPAAISPNTKQIAFIRNYPSENESALMVADPTGHNARRLSTRSISESFAAQKGGLAWSPDESLLVSPVFNEGSTGHEMQLMAVNAQSGEQQALTSQKWTWIGQPAWFKDGSGVLFPANDSQSQMLPDGIWTVSYPSGQLRQISREINGFFGLSLTADSSEMSVIQSDRLTTFWNVSLEAPKQPAKIAQSFSQLSFFPLGISASPDGKIVYALAKNGNVDIWSMNPDGTGQKPLTTNSGADFEPVVSADGRFIVYLSVQAGRQNIRRMNFDGTDIQQLTDSKRVASPSITADGQWIYYAGAKDDDRSSFVWKLPSDGGIPQQITFEQAFQPKISPDGKFLACYYPDVSAPEQKNNGGLKLTILSAEDGKILKQFDETPVRSETAIMWTPDSRAVVFLKGTDGVSNLWLRSMTENTPRQLTDSTESIVRFAISFDGKTLIYEKGVLINNIVLIHEP